MLGIRYVSETGCALGPLSLAEAMEDFDAMWWELRQDLDHYLQASQDSERLVCGFDSSPKLCQAYVEATKEAVKMLQGYSAHCKADFADLKMAYARSSRAALRSSVALKMSLRQGAQGPCRVAEGLGSSDGKLRGDGLQGSGWQHLGAPGSSRPAILGTLAPRRKMLLFKVCS